MSDVVIEPTNVQTGAEVEAAGAPDVPAAGDGGDGSDAPAEGGELAPLKGGRIVDCIIEAVTFTMVIVRLGIAAAAMLLLSQAVDGAYGYVEGCASTVDGLADIAASLNVDDTVTGAHHDAAGVMRETLALADALSSEAQEMSTEFNNAASGHEGDYGDVNEAMQTGDADVAEREYYSNR